MGSAWTGWVDGLDEARVSRADAEFFASGRAPGGHFRRRLRLLMTEAGADGDAGAGVPVTFGRLTVPPEDDGGGRMEFVQVESVALVHQLAEAVWSMLLAAGADVRSPSLFLAGLTTPELTRRVAEAVDDPAVLDRLLRDALLVDEPVAGEGYADGMTAGLAAAGRLLRLAAFRLRDDRRLYNAIKHGFAVATPREEISFTVGGVPGADGPDAEEMALSRTAIWLTVLERRKDENGRWWWAVVKTALDDLDQEFWLVQMLTHVLDGFWGCARARCGHAGEVRVRLPTAQDVDRLNAETFLLRRVVFDDLYTERQGHISFTLYGLQPATGSDEVDPDGAGRPSGSASG